MYHLMSMTSNVLSSHGSMDKLTLELEQAMRIDVGQVATIFQIIATRRRKLQMRLKMFQKISCYFVTVICIQMHTVKKIPPHPITMDQ